MKSFLPLVLVAGLLGGSCRSQSASSATTPTPAAPAAAAALIEQWSGAYGDVTTAATRTLTTADAWKELWRQVQRDAPRPLDPSREMAVAVFLGERRTGGYAVEIVAVRAAEGRLVVEYRESSPAPDMMVTQAITAPWAIALIARTELPVVFQKLRSPGARREQ